MPDVSQAEIGRRLYHVHRGKTVESAMKMMQQNIGEDWKSLSEDDVRILGHLLQCTWNTIDQAIWNKIPFVKMTMKDVRQILSHGDGVSPGHNPSPEAVAAIKTILTARS
jgi:hypothetical protein